MTITHASRLITAAIVLVSLLAAALLWRVGWLQGVALVVVTISAVCVAAAVWLFYRWRVLKPVTEIVENLRDVIARKDGAAIGYQDDASEIGDLARAIERYRFEVDRAERRTRVLLAQTRTNEAALRRLNVQADSALELTRAGHWSVPLDGSGWYTSSERVARILGDPPSPDHRYRLDHWARHVRAGDPEAAEAALKNFDAAVAGDTSVYDATYAYKRPLDGRVVWISSLGRVTKNAAGTPTAMVGVTQDITDFKLLEIAWTFARQENERLIRDESESARHRSVAQMVAGVAHEVNTPLGIIRTAADLIAQTLASPAITALGHASEAAPLVDDLAEASRLIDRNAARAHKLVQDFKKVSVNQITDVKEAVDLVDLVSETAELFRVSARQSRMELSIVNDLPGGRGEWLGYPGSLSQVLLNLLANAQRYAYADNAGGRVEIALSPGGEDGYRITVRDFGKGIAPEHLPHIFDPFFTTGRGKGGSGLGMAIVYNIVTAHLGGAVTIESTPGQGTVVAITLPRTVAR